METGFCLGSNMGGRLHLLRQAKTLILLEPQVKFVDQAKCDILYDVFRGSFKIAFIEILPDEIDQLLVLIPEEPIQRLFLKFLFHDFIDG